MDSGWRVENFTPVQNLARMVKKIKKWTLRFIATGIFLAVLLLTFMLNPTLLYANKSVVGNYSIYHNKPINNRFLDQLEQSNAILKSSELFDAGLKMDICLKDGAKYPALIKTVLGKDPLTTFYNKIVFTGDEVNYEGNYISFEGHKLNLTELLVHVQVHCLEFNNLDFGTPIRLPATQNGNGRVIRNILPGRNQEIIA